MLTPTNSFLLLGVLRVRLDLIEMYKIMTGEEAVDREHFFQLSSCEYN